MIVFEVHVIFFFLDFRNFAELVHIELADEWGDVFVSEVVGEDFVLKLFRVFDDDLVVVEPGEVVGVLFFLNGA